LQQVGNELGNTLTHCSIQQDQQDYHKADPSVYFQLAEKLDNAGFDEISIEDAHRHNDLSLFDLFKKSKVSG
jgi:5-methyltetrahydropteroyltriglutamate--homocysteine methyltransferase